MEAFLKSEGVNANTAKTYAYFYEKIIKSQFEGKEPENMMSDESADKVLEFVNSDVKISNGSKCAYVRAWRGIAMRKKAGDNVKLLRYVKTTSEDMSYTPANKKDLSNKIDLNYVIQKREEYQKNVTDTFHTNDMYHLQSCLYSYLPPLRSQDYYDTVIKTDTTDLEKDNYYDLETKQLIINNCKTTKSKGQRVIDVPDELADEISKFHERSKSSYMICTRTGHKLDANSFRKSMHRCLKKDISSSMLRNCFISSKIDEGITAEERKRTAKIMGHSVATQQAIYSKFSDVLHPKEDDLDYLVRMNKKLTAQLQENNKKILQYFNKK